MSTQTHDIYRNSPIDFEKFLQTNATDKKIADAETRLREEQKASEHRLYITCNRIEAKLDAHIIETKQSFDKLEGKFEKLEGKFESFKLWLIGILITIFLSAFGIIAVILFS